MAQHSNAKTWYRPHHCSLPLSQVIISIIIAMTDYLILHPPPPPPVIIVHRPHVHRMNTHSSGIHHHSTIIPFYHFTTLPFRHSTIQQFYHSTILLLVFYNSIIILPSTMLPFDHSTKLPFHHSTIIVSLHHSTIYHSPYSMPIVFL